MIHVHSEINNIEGLPDNVNKTTLREIVVIFFKKFERKQMYQ